MESSSRRGFLMGRRPSSNPWDKFCERLRRNIKGSLYDFGATSGVGSARLVPGQPGDVHHARALCAEYRVVLALGGISQTATPLGQSVLWVEPGNEMGGFKRLSEGSPQWFVQPGCFVGELCAAGFQALADIPGHLTVAAWLADRTLCDWNTGETCKSGLDHASVLLADGTTATLGPFGEDSRQPLENLMLQHLVPDLFQLSGKAAAQSCRRLTPWAARYRLDALFPCAGQTINLAHLLLGHGGALGWVEWVVLNELTMNCDMDTARPAFSTHHDSSEDEAWFFAADLDAQVKTLFDPNDLFPYTGQDI
ncbi:hypothetical protein [Paralcaligenes ureilyticus]|uniref:Uncharacterized protein n=1 Tax=Paralcaligenes ureilyticus TaxID=627131 RepID=A0A4V2UZG7_9BURK|nr:hypothetical protein [Paralcaligenes ureilyticus]TCT10788.1 hypothetical protein EDC26_1014 [Paralcaligenes ureilyticus]